ncbi:MAG: hypothetical protein IKL09_06730 [Clostridia bacterium]|nr:hypothetical protein [Clostridia bacterium]
MKPFLGIDLTENKKNKQINGQEFLVQKTSAALTSTLEASSAEAEKTVDSSKLPLPLRIIQYVCGIAALLIAGGILEADISLQEAYNSAPWFFWITGMCAVIWLILWLCGKQKAKTVLGTDESAQTFSHLEGTENAIYQELSVPDNAKDVDVLLFHYKLKNGEISMQTFQYFNPEFKIFSDDKNLYLANLEGKYAFPLSSVVKIHTVKKHIRILGWNKEEKCNKGIYKQYKLTTDSYGYVHCKQYHILELNHQGESVGIYFPCYELPVFVEHIKQKQI